MIRHVVTLIEILFLYNNSFAEYLSAFFFSNDNLNDNCI